MKRFKILDVEMRGFKTAIIRAREMETGIVITIETQKELDDKDGIKNELEEVFKIQMEQKYILIGEII